MENNNNGVALSNKRRMDRIAQKLLEREEVELDKYNEELYQKELERERARQEKEAIKIQKTINKKRYSDFDLQEILFDSDTKTATKFYNENTELCKAYFERVLKKTKGGGSSGNI